MAYAGLLRLAFESLCNNCQRSEVLDDLPAEGGEKKDCLVIFLKNLGCSAVWFKNTDFCIFSRKFFEETWPVILTSIVKMKLSSSWFQKWVKWTGISAITKAGFSTVLPKDDTPAPEVKAIRKPPKDRAPYEKVKRKYVKRTAEAKEELEKLTDSFERTEITERR